MTNQRMIFTSKINSFLRCNWLFQAYKIEKLPVNMSSVNTSLQFLQIFRVNSAVQLLYY